MKSDRFGSLVISLDFELMWGILDQENPLAYQENIIGGRKAIPRILKCFDEYDIHATWAVVGVISFDSYVELKKSIPDVRPKYKDLKLSSYEHMDVVSKNNRDLFFAPELIRLIKDTRNQEIASHTFSHFYCLEKGQTKEDFRNDIKSAIEALKEYTDHVDSIVFPRNQCNDEYAEVLKEYGIKNIRGTESPWIYRPTETGRDTNIFKRGVRLADSYFNITGHNTYEYENLKYIGGLVNVPSSRFLRPYDKKLSSMEPYKMRRISQQMEYAAKHRRIFHLWWHPHNFGTYIEENMKNLITVLDFYKKLEEEYGMMSLSMSEVGALTV